MIAETSPALVLILGALLMPLVPRALRGPVTVALPLVAIFHLLSLPMGEAGKLQVMGLQLTTLRLDKLSFLFSLIFLVAAALAAVYALFEKDLAQQVAAPIYAGSAVGAVLAGDLVTLFVFWEGTAIASVFLIWASRTERAYAAGMRYLIVQIGSGVLLLAGVLLHYRATGSITFGALGLDGSLGKLLIFVAFGIKCAFPLLHNWLQDAYPEATVSGTVVLSSFTTKLAVYALARSFAGTEILVPIGVTMAIGPIAHAMIENDLRRTLAYSLNSQLGFMVAAVGIGSELALNGATAHAVSSILYTSLLYMGVGAVLLRTGTAKGTELGGLFRSMPFTAAFTLVGAATISAAPLFISFVSKGMILAAAQKGGYELTWLLLLLAAAGAVLHTGVRIPDAAFFGRDSGKSCNEAPANMLIAMGITAASCIGLGVYPQPLYDLLPFKVDFAPYTFDHVLAQLQLLTFALLAFTVLMRTGNYPRELRSTNLDTDWLWRKPGKAIVLGLHAGLVQGWRLIEWAALATARTAERQARRHHSPDGIMGRPWPTGTMALWTTLMLGAYLILSYV